MSIKVIVDSTVDLKENLKERVFSIIPLTVRFGSEEYLDGVTITHQQFYDKLVNTDVFPSTSQANPESFEKVFASLDKQDQAIVITLSSNLSGTYQSAVIAASDYPNVRVIDSKSVAIGSGILAQYAFDLIDKGCDIDEVAEELCLAREKIVLVAVLDTLEYLKRGGRISKTAAFAGNILNIKPVLSLVEGAINVLGKARGMKMGGNLLEKEIEKVGGVDYSMPVLLGYTGNDDAMILKYIDDSERLWKSQLGKVEYTVVGCTIGAHGGPGAVAVAFFKK
ncbi:MAG: DegV family protein [Erysipelotrichaceae bacterium]